MDDADRAKESQERFERKALAAQLATIPSGESAAECEDCGEPIPEARRKAAPGCTRCIACQQGFERRLKSR